jgi:hypothetical protein
MATVIVSAIALSLTTGLKSADQVSGTYQFIPKSKITLAARGSAAGMTCSLLVNGIAVVNDQPVAYFGTSGAMSINDHIMASQAVGGGRVELYFRNPTGGTLTVDYWLAFDPM